MKNFIAVLFLLFLSGCKCYEKINYSELSAQELLDKKTDLELSLNYVIVNSVVSGIENGKKHMSLTKINKEISTNYLQEDPRLTQIVDTWKHYSSKISKFEKEHKPQLQELGKLLRTKKISEDTYFQKNREFRAELIADFPIEYPKLSENHLKSLRLMWSKAGRFMIEDYKMMKKEFPLDWISKDEFIKAQSLREYKCISNTIKMIENKI